MDFLFSSISFYNKSGKYIEIMCEKLISEYYNIRGNESGILRKINEGREEKITFNDYPYAFNI